MMYQRTMVLLASCLAASACSMPDTAMMNGAITLKDNVVTLHASDAPDAIIGADGNLQIDGKLVALTAPQRGLLMLYQHNVQDVHDLGMQMGKVGAHMGKQALQDKLSGKSGTVQSQDADAGAHHLHQLGQKMCQDQANIKAVQDQLASELPAFKPYGSIVSDKSIQDCKSDDD